MIGTVIKVGQRFLLIALESGGHVKIPASQGLEPGDRVTVNMTERAAVRVDAEQ